MKYMKPQAIADERDAISEELQDKNSHLHKLYLTDRNSPELKAAQTKANDLNVASFPLLRGWPVRWAYSSGFPVKPSQFSYWMTYPRERHELFHSEIKSTLTGSSIEDLQELVADLVVFCMGVAESGIDQIKSHCKADGSLMLPNGRLVPAELTQLHFNNYSLAKTIFNLLIFNEKMLKSKQSKRSVSGRNTKAVTEKLIYSEIKVGGWRQANNISAFIRDMQEKHPIATPSPSTVRRHWSKYWEGVNEKK